MEQTSSLKYNYVICGAGGYYDIGYRDIMDLSGVNYYSSYIDCAKTKLGKLLVRLNFSEKVNRIVSTPLSRLVYPLVYKPSFDEKKPLCYLFFGNVQYVYQTSFLDYLRATYPEVKLVLYMQDLISRNSKLQFDIYRDKFDLILSYDKGDATKYGLPFHPTPMSDVFFESDPNLEKSDVYFCGFAKTRYPLIHELYKKYTELGLECDFHIMQYPNDEERIEGVHYEDKIFTYEQNIQHVLNTKAVLEIMQEGADGFTPRVWESIIYSKHLLTNNETLRLSEYYDEKFMHDINSSNIRGLINTPVSYSTQQKARLSPVHLLEYIDKLLP